MQAGYSAYPPDAGRQLDALGQSRKLMTEMKIHFDMLRNYFWYTG